MRISPGPNGEKVHKNAFNQRLLRFRDSWCLLAWHQGRIPDPKTRASVANRLSDQQIAQNTSRGTTPGLVDPSAGESGGRVPIPLSGRVGAAPSTINQRTNRVSQRSINIDVANESTPVTAPCMQQRSMTGQSQRLLSLAYHNMTTVLTRNHAQGKLSLEQCMRVHCTQIRCSRRKEIATVLWEKETTNQP